MQMMWLNQRLKDLFPDDVNYYRLRLNELNGNSSLSKVIVVKSETSKQKIWVTENPFHDFIDLKMINSENKLYLQLINAAGGVVAQTEITNPKQQFRWWLNNRLSKGVYVLKVTTKEEVFTYKLIKD